MLVHCHTVMASGGHVIRMVLMVLFRLRHVAMCAVNCKFVSEDTLQQYNLKQVVHCYLNISIKVLSNQMTVSEWTQKELGAMAVTFLHRSNGLCWQINKLP